MNDSKNRNFGRNFIERSSWDANMEKYTPKPRTYAKEIMTVVGLVFFGWLAIQLTNLLNAMIAYAGY